MINFSLIVPTRKRVNLLTNLCLSIQTNTANLNNIEMLAIGDLDDSDTISTFNALSQYTWFHGHLRERSNSISRDYQNWVYPQSKGKYIFVINDDVELQTPGWDIIALSKINQHNLMYLDGILYGWTADSENIRIHDDYNSYACFPILSRTSIDILGYVMKEHYAGWGADVYLYNVYNEVNRVLDLSNILVKHYTHWLGNREQDETTTSMKEKSTQVELIDHHADAEKLRKHITMPERRSVFYL